MRRIRGFDIHKPPWLPSRLWSRSGTDRHLTVGLWQGGRTAGWFPWRRGETPQSPDSHQVMSRGGRIAPPSRERDKSAHRPTGEEETL
ncbi:unnamed protein product [Merluccius merluccius]